MKKIINPLFYITTIYSFVTLPIIARTGGPCNAGVALIGIGLFLIISSTLTFFAIKNITKTLGKILSILSLFIWGFWTIGSSIDDPSTGIIYFVPFFITTIVTTIFSFNVKHTNEIEKNTSA